MEYNVGDIVRTKKQHPCGSKLWELTRVGVDFKMKCLGCGHIIVLERPKALKAIHKADKVFRKAGISLPVKSMKKTDENNRFNEGLKVQETIFGERIRRMHENAPENQKHIQNYLSAMCFGDFYTRDGLDIKMRELLTLCILSALGGCENQLRSHIEGNLSAGNDKDIMIEAVTQCMPYIGFPRTLNALGCINETA